MASLSIQDSFSAFSNPAAHFICDVQLQHHRTPPSHISSNFGGPFPSCPPAVSSPSGYPIFVEGSAVAALFRLQVHQAPYSVTGGSPLSNVQAHFVTPSQADVQSLPILMVDAAVNALQKLLCRRLHIGDRVQDL